MDNFNDLNNAVNALSKGAFLVTGKDKPNIMTIGWGAVGILWYKNIFIVPIRKSRFSKEIVDKNNCFSVCVPYNKLAAELKYCGTYSGRNVDKFAKTGLIPVKAKKIDSYIVEGCDMYYECKVLYSIPLEKDRMLSGEADCYASNDMHTLYIAEIVASYTK